MQLYTRHELDRIPWPATAEGDYARRVLGTLAREGTRTYVANVEAEVRVLLIEGTVLPLVVVDGPSGLANPSYVASPITHYVDYARREVELELHDHPVLRRLFPPLLSLFRPLLHWGEIERAVYVNNWLLSTNLYPTLSPAALIELHARLVRAFPTHAIIFRSVNDTLDHALGDLLTKRGYRRVISRQVYLLDPQTGGHRKKKSYQKDRGLARRTPYRWLDAGDLTESDVPRLKRLYDDLYLDKYSRYNPQFTEAFFLQVLRSRWLTMQALVADDRIDGVLGFVERQGVMTTPLIGYDRSLDEDRGLYRLISWKLIDEAERRGRILHQSSGAAAFKKHRGSVGSIEYSYVYDLHLLHRRRLPWQLLERISTHLAVPLMQRLEL